VNGDGAGIDNTLRLKVLQVEQLGGHGFVHCELPDASHAMVVQFEGQNVIHAGSIVSIAIPPQACHVFAAGEDGRVIPSIV
jgi:ABC-type sugar transport system ATPase subunit